jgi:ferredoxin-NADP reductase
VAESVARLVRRETVADGTMAFRFSKPQGFLFKAGQNILLTPGDGWESHTFTIASAPHEPEIMIATRMRDSAYKRRLGALAPGDAVMIDGPNGMMVLHGDATRPAVFIAGGIGITPFLAMLRDASHRRLPHRSTLFYSNRRAASAAFLDELQAIERAHLNFRLVSTLTEEGGEPIAEALLRRHVADLTAPVYYVAGPPGMTIDVQGMIIGLGVSPDQIHSEEFYGY